jgi:hypothetical protein
MNITRQKNYKRTRAITPEMRILRLKKTIKDVEAENNPINEKYLKMLKEQLAELSPVSEETKKDLPTPTKLKKTTQKGGNIL